MLLHLLPLPLPLPLLLLLLLLLLPLLLLLLLLLRLLLLRRFVGTRDHSAYSLPGTMCRTMCGLCAEAGGDHVQANACMCGAFGASLASEGWHYFGEHYTS